MKAVYFFLALSSCAHLPSDYFIKATQDIVRSNPNYTMLNESEADTLDRVIEKIDTKRNKAYYVYNLLSLLNTEFIPNSTQLREARAEVAEESLVIVKNKLYSGDVDENIEEEYEGLVLKSGAEWEYIYSRMGGSKYGIIVNNNLDILVKIKISVYGDPNEVKRLKLMEDAVEKHMAIPGFSVNIEWVDRDNDADDIFYVLADSGTWAQTHVWNGGYETMAHEAFHLLDLEDEYNLIDTHSTNKYLPFQTRLNFFLKQMDKTEYPNAIDGIMWFSENKPLHRHICWVANLNYECIKDRLEYFGPTHK